MVYNVLPILKEGVGGQTKSLHTMGQNSWENLRILPSTRVNSQADLKD